MFKDNTNFRQEDKENMSIQMLSEDGHNVHMTGQITDKIYKNGKLVQVIEGHNLVVNSFLKMVMTLCKGQAGYAGLQYWAVGSGATSWDTSMPDPEINASRLTAEIGRVPISASEITFLNAEFVSIVCSD